MMRESNQSVSLTYRAAKNVVNAARRLSRQPYGENISFRHRNRIPASYWIFLGFKFNDTNNIRIKARSFITHPTNIEVQIIEQDVLLSGSPCWVSASINKQALTASVLVTTSRPASDNTYTNVALYRFTLVDTDIYALDHCGWWDINSISLVATT